ncbi:HD superfamily phosphodiesterase [Pedobacter sp. UYP30]|uniref:Pycsar system effector family protein n=1 Tax=Pedobacter sp. UYP30 TaxID=1756400 RepID=UPI003396EEDE
MDYNQLLHEVKIYVTNYYETHNDPKLTYHDFGHTENVVNAATQIGSHHQLKEQDMFMLVTAAYFHDIGYFDDPKTHEEIGARMAKDFLTEKKVPLEMIAQVQALINSTKMPQAPHTNLEEMLCDADLFHLGLKDFAEKSKKIHAEVAQLVNLNLSKKEWREKDIAFLQSHHFHTGYVKKLLQRQKQKNLDKLEKKVAAKHSKKEDKPLEVVNEESSENEKSPPKIFDVQNIEQSKKKGVAKGVETLFRITSTNNQRLSDMADNKAHILITVNSIMLSLIVSLVLRRLDNNTFLVVPTFLLLFVCLTCVVISILSTRPTIPAGTFTQEQLDTKKVNLIFFGNFYKMSLQRYREGMIDVMNDLDFLYGTLITDVYSQGVVLGKKYKLIRLAYNVFMYGLIVSVLCFVITYFWYGKI